MAGKRALIAPTKAAFFLGALIAAPGSDVFLGALQASRRASRGTGGQAASKAARPGSITLAAAWRSLAPFTLALVAAACCLGASRPADGPAATGGFACGRTVDGIKVSCR